MALARVRSESLCALEPFSELLRVRIVVSYEDIVNFGCPSDVVVESYDFLVALSASQLGTALWVQSVRGHSVYK